MSEMNERPVNQSVAKLLQLVSVLAASRTPMRLQDVAREANMPQATCLRYLNALIQEGFAGQDRDRTRYFLTWGICSLGDRVRARQSLRVISGDILNELAAELGLGICLVVEHGMECMYLDCLYEPETMGYTLMRIGTRTPLHAVSSGKILLTEYSETALDRVIAEKGLPALTEKTITTKAALLEELQRVRQQGYALDNEECELGLRCVAVPLRDYSGKAVAAISAFGSVERVTDGLLREKLLPALRTAAAELSFRMGSGFASRE